MLVQCFDFFNVLKTGLKKQSVCLRCRYFQTRRKTASSNYCVLTNGLKFLVKIWLFWPCQQYMNLIKLYLHHEAHLKWKNILIDKRAQNWKDDYVLVFHSFIFTFSEEFLLVWILSCSYSYKIYGILANCESIWKK